ncbi:3-hydroxyisobutyrate dehydrogenase [Amycolatopsis arida]|uniref:3-hydroxyisobutyrate dehydrogenase n=1 Tax=Amycolatopsis arida TaxID=587909 RepID=A0A1I6A7V5_9PSEU|nr:NAD(P)-dependent oxidoreductase [Amycolatopsis arida]TDX88538.1 3-hydroxyisobutyrate dehydrogenase-like beta-hydroxyacid dehydrogenase [Amycolatopsis arida]SFQ64758.1 3-hydroxyisobutyrate dehydrogenase [Amycolatopsis arida]
MTYSSITCLGLGEMGAGLAGRLIDTGHRIVVHDPAAPRAEPLVADGAVRADTPADAVGAADAVVISLDDEDAVRSALFGPDGAAAALRSGSLVVDTSPVSPAGSRRLGAELAELGLRRVEICPLGRPDQARTGELRMLVAGQDEHVAASRVLLRHWGDIVIPAGGLGGALTLKLVFNALLGAQLASLAEAVGFGERAGLNREQLLGAIASSNFASAAMTYRIGLLRENRFTQPAASSAMLHEDLRQAVEVAAEHGMLIPAVAAAAEHFGTIVDAGDGDLDAAVALRP